MPHSTALIATLAWSLALAFLFGLLAARLKLPPLVGYLVAGIVAGPYTPGFTADPALASQLAEIGVVLLMFGVGLHFSVRDLLSVRRIAVPGALVQIAVVTLLGAVLARAWGWPWNAGVVFGLTLSVASTVVVLRLLDERGLLDSVNGRLAVGWLIVEDVVMVVVLVLLPALAPGGDAVPRGVASAVAVTLAKVGVFAALMYFGGRRAVPWLLERVARAGSRELFTLSVLATALGVAFGAATLFGVSLALGAFLAGVVISESDLSHQAAADALPLQDAFAVLFFVSVGMLFDPAVLVRHPGGVVAVVALTALGKPLVAGAYMLVRRQPLAMALTMAASRAQIGEFSFILAGLGVSLAVMPAEALSLVLAGALISITLNPLAFASVHALERWVRARPALFNALERSPKHAPPVADRTADAAMSRHAILVGHGRVGSAIASALAARGLPYVVVESDRVIVESLRERGVRAIYGDASRPGILEHAHPERATLLIVTAPDPYYARQIVEHARHVNPAIRTVVRTHTAAEQQYLEAAGVGRAIHAERELAFAMAHYSLQMLDVSDDEADVVIAGLRR